MLRAQKQTQTIDIKFGLNINNREQSGCFIYNQHRLILMYEDVLGKNASIEHQGIVGIIDIPYSIMNPTNSKQNFADEEEYKRFKRVLAEYLNFYIEDARKYLKKDKLIDFWREIGYLNDDVHIPSNDPLFVRRRTFKLPIFLQCNICLNWRYRNATSEDINKTPSDNFCCENLLGVL